MKHLRKNKFQIINTPSVHGHRCLDSSLCTSSFQKRLLEDLSGIWSN